MNYDEMTAEQLEALLENLDKQRLEAIAKIRAEAKRVRQALTRKLSRVELDRYMSNPKLKELVAKAGVAETKAHIIPPKG